MAHLNLYKNTAYKTVYQGASALQPFHQKDLLTRLGCINWILRDTSRLASLLAGERGLFSFGNYLGVST